MLETRKGLNMASIRTVRSYNRLADGKLSAFAGATALGLTNNTDLPTPPVLATEITTLQTAFDDAIVKAVDGAKIDTVAKNAARADLITALDKNASYVDINCNDDLSVLLSSGYQAVSTNRAQTILNAPNIVSVDSPQTGALKVRISADFNSKSYVGRIKAATGSEFGPSISFASSRKIVFDGLTAGVTYVMQLCAIGGSTGKSDWTEPFTKMSM